MSDDLTAPRRGNRRLKQRLRGKTLPAPAGRPSPQTAAEKLRPERSEHRGRNASLKTDDMNQRPAA